MVDIPKLGEIATSAAAQIVARVVPERAYSHLAVFVPGLFFEISIFFANPVLVCDWFINRSFPLGRSMLITIALILAFIIGNGFMLIPGLIQYFLFRPLYRVWWFLWRRFCAGPLRSFAVWLIRNPRLRNLLPADSLHNYVVDIGVNPHPEEQKDAWQCWITLARRLLTTRYEIKSEDLDDGEWNILYSVLGIWTPEDLRGNLMFIYLEATGWAGLAATRLAPALRTKYYFSFSALLIVAGLLHDFYYAKRRYDPRYFGYMNIVAVLRELRRSPNQKTEDTTDET